MRALPIVLLACLPPPEGAGSVGLPDRVAVALQGVVDISVRELARLPTFRNGRFVDEEVEGAGAGSGVVISEDGLILTNAHVVAGSETVQVGFASGRAAPARLLAVDEASDLALIAVAADGLRAVRFADRPPQPGAIAYVVGNRGGRGHQIVRARIGSHRRVRVGARPLEFWGEVEARVGPGNSGGAVLNEQGELVGVPSLLLRYTDREERMAAPHSAGLFIPARHAVRAVARMRGGGRAVWPWIGLLLDDPLLATAAGRRWNDGDAPQVRRVLPGSPAEEAGFRSGDRITAIGGAPVRDNFEALDAVLDLEVGAALQVRIERDGATILLDLATAERPADPRPDAVDDFMLHTGLRLEPRGGRGEGDAALVFAEMSQETRHGMPAIEFDLFSERPALASLLPGGDLLQGGSRRTPIDAASDLEGLIARCFVREQFVAMAHWSLGGRRTLDQAHVHRKVYPFVI
jgi:S1-C subfamily serine protease